MHLSPLPNLRGERARRHGRDAAQKGTRGPANFGLTKLALLRGRGDGDWPLVNRRRVARRLRIGRPNGKQLLCRVSVRTDTRLKTQAALPCVLAQPVSNVTGAQVVKRVATGF